MILLDTHTLVWWTSEPKRISKEATQLIRRSSRAGGVAVAAISLWEIALLCMQGKLQTNGTIKQTVQAMLDVSRVHVFETTAEIAATAVQLPDSVPRDPGDRLIVATALVHAIPLVTKDARIQDSRICKTVW